MKLGQLINGPFQAAFAKLASQPVPLRAAYSLRSVEKQIKEEATKYDSLRLEALKRYAPLKEDGSFDKDENGNVKLPDDKLKLFLEEVQGLLDVEVPVNPIKISDLGENVRLSGSEVSLLENLLVE